MRPAAALIAMCFALAIAGCGGSTSGDSKGGQTGTPAAPPGSLEALWRAQGEDVAIVAGTSDYGPGPNRVSFLIVDRRSRLVATKTAKVWVARGLRQAPFLETTAASESIGVPGGDRADAAEIYVTHVDLPAPGRYWILAEPVGGKQIQALGNVVVKKEPATPGLGDHAIPSETPTLADVGGDPSKITTATPPDTELLRTSVAQAIAAREPFVVAFATPKFCQSRTCGPVVQVVQAVARKLEGSGVRFIHVEVYEDNDPAKGTNRWVDEWHLPTEPFTFVVDRHGIIRAKLEGAFSVGELEAAVEKVT